MFKKTILMTVVSVALSGVAMAEDVPNWQMGGDVFMGAGIPLGSALPNAGVTMGGRGSARYESDGRRVLIYGELSGEAYNNSAGKDDIQFSQFYVNTGLMLGAPSVKWKTPLNVSVSRDVLINEALTIRYAFSGLYIKFMDDAKVDDGKVHQFMEMVTDFVISQVNYQWGNAYNYEQCPAGVTNCGRGDPNTASNNRSLLGLYAALKYEIEQNGWGTSFQVELVQDLSPAYTKVQGRVIGFKELKGNLEGLRPYVELAGIADHDALDPTGKFQGAIRVFGGISGRFGF